MYHVDPALVCTADRAGYNNWTGMGLAQLPTTGAQIEIKAVDWPKGHIPADRTANAEPGCWHTLPLPHNALDPHPAGQTGWLYRVMVPTATATGFARVPFYQTLNGGSSTHQIPVAACLDVQLQVAWWTTQ